MSARGAPRARSSGPRRRAIACAVGTASALRAPLGVPAARADAASSTWLPGGSRAIERTASASRDAAVSALVFAPRVAAKGGTSLQARTAIAPEGPWSGPIEMARCTLDPAIPGVFCGCAAQHREIASHPGQVVLSYDDRSLSSDAGPHLPGAWPRVVTTDVPATLP